MEILTRLGGVARAWIFLHRLNPPTVVEPLFLPVTIAMRRLNSLAVDGDVSQMSHLARGMRNSSLSQLVAM